MGIYLVLKTSQQIHFAVWYSLYLSLRQSETYILISYRSFSFSVLAYMEGLLYAVSVLLAGDKMGKVAVSANKKGD